MAKSNARKFREHRTRMGERDVTLSRGINPAISMHERRTKTKKDIIEKEAKKYNRYE